MRYAIFAKQTTIIWTEHQTAIFPQLALILFAVDAGMNLFGTTITEGSFYAHFAR